MKNEIIVVAAQFLRFSYLEVVALNIAAQAFGKDMRLEVSFDSVGTKQLMAAFAKLEKIEK